MAAAVSALGSWLFYVVLLFSQKRERPLIEANSVWQPLWDSRRWDADRVLPLSAKSRHPKQPRPDCRNERVALKIV